MNNIFFNDGTKRFNFKNPSIFMLLTDKGNYDDGFHSREWYSFVPYIISGINRDFQPQGNILDYTYDVYFWFRHTGYSYSPPPSSTRHDFSKDYYIGRRRFDVWTSDVGTIEELLPGDSYTIFEKNWFPYYYIGYDADIELGQWSEPAGGGSGNSWIEKIWIEKIVRVSTGEIIPNGYTQFIDGHWGGDIEYPETIKFNLSYNEDIRKNL